MLEGKLTILRPLTLDDLVFVKEWGKNPEINQYLSGSFKVEMLTLNDNFEDILRKRNCKVFALEDKNGRLIGNLKLDQITWRNKNAELSICIGETDSWNNGYGTDAIISLLTYAFNEMNLLSVYLRVAGYNKRAIHCYRKCGFRSEARLRNALEFEGQDYDLILMRINKEDFYRRQRQIETNLSVS